MKNKEEYKVFLLKVPALRTGWKALLTVLYLLSLIVISILFFYYFDPLA